MHRTIRYDLSRFKDCKTGDGQTITAFTIRTTDGGDETYAAKRAEAKSTGLTEELIRVSIVSFEIAGGTGPVEARQPFEAFDAWSTKARNFVVAAWKKTATPDEAELADFFKSASDIE